MSTQYERDRDRAGATVNPSVSVPEQRQRYVQPSRWTSWVTFGGLMMIVAGMVHGLVGLVALYDQGFYLVSTSQLVVDVGYTAWGWLHLAFGAVALATGVALLAARTWARWVGIGVAALSALVNMVYLPAYPLWSLVVITLDVVIIYALAVHAQEAFDQM